MNALALILAVLSLGFSTLLFVVVRKLIEGMALAGEALEEMAKLLERMQ